MNPPTLQLARLRPVRLAVVHAHRDVVAEAVKVRGRPAAERLSGDPLRSHRIVHLVSRADLDREGTGSLLHRVPEVVQRLLVRVELGQAPEKLF